MPYGRLVWGPTGSMDRKAFPTVVPFFNEVGPSHTNLILEFFRANP